VQYTTKVWNKVAYTTLLVYTVAMFERCLYFNVNTLSRKVNRIWMEAFETVGLSPSHAYLLRFVLAEPGLSQQAIANALNLEKSTITRFINKMESEGFIVRRVPATRNTREQAIYPTEKAQQLHAELERIGDNLYADMLKAIGADKLKQLVKDLREAGYNL
jgi:DNA-binding MarR family transcriptional regulator